jgi:lipid-binding SYLF domain-containing protein
LGREADASFNFSERGGLGVTVNYAFSKGVFGGISIETAVLNARSKENERFYGKPVKASEILFEDAVETPKGKGVEEVSLYHVYLCVSSLVLESSNIYTISLFSCTIGFAC